MFFSTWHAPWLVKGTVGDELPSPKRAVEWTGVCRESGGASAGREFSEQSVGEESCFLLDLLPWKPEYRVNAEWTGGQTALWGRTEGDGEGHLHSASHTGKCLGVPWSSYWNAHTSPAGLLGPAVLRLWEAPWRCWCCCFLDHTVSSISLGRGREGCCGGLGSPGTNSKDGRFCCSWSFLFPVRAGNSSSSTLDIWGLISVCWSARSEARGCPMLCKMFAAPLASAHWMLGSPISPSTPMSVTTETFPDIAKCPLLFNCVQLFATPWTAACQTPLCSTVSWSLLMSVKSVMLPNHLILCCPLLLLPSVFSSPRVFSNE